MFFFCSLLSELINKVGGIKFLGHWPTLYPWKASSDPVDSWFEFVWTISIISTVKLYLLIIYLFHLIFPQRNAEQWASPKQTRVESSMTIHVTIGSRIMLLLIGAIALVNSTQEVRWKPRACVTRASVYKYSQGRGQRRSRAVGFFPVAFSSETK